MSNFILGDLDTKFKVGSADCRVYLGDTCVYSGDTPTPHDYSQDYFTVRAIDDDITLYLSSTIESNTFSYSTDGGTTWSEPSGSIEVTINSGDTVLFKGSGNTSSINKPVCALKPMYTDRQYELEGNIMSLLYGDNFVGQTDLSNYPYAFTFFVQLGKTTPAPYIASIENLALPATTLANNCYASMFSYCTSLTTAPILPATTLADSCYKSMFKGCTSLTTAPVLSVTTLADSCYASMFNGCTSLTTAPTLSATTLANNCYKSMFYHCASLNSITCLATDISASNCTGNWVNGVAASGTFTKAASMTSWTSGTSGIPSGWTVVDYSG